MLVSDHEGGISNRIVFFGHYMPIILFKINRYVNIFKIYRIRQKAAVFLKKILRPLQPTKMM